MLTHGELTGSGKNKLSFDQVAIDKATAYSAEDADVILRLWRVLKPRLIAERMTRSMRRWSGRWFGAGADGAARHLDRPPGAVAAVGRIRPDRGAGRSRNSGDRRRAGQCRQPQADRRHLFGKMGMPGGSKTKTGAWSTSAQILDELAEQGHEFPKKILEWRQVSKLKSTYTDALPTYVIRRPIACTPPTRWRRPPPGGCRRTSRTCRTFRCAPRTAARSAAPSSPPPATSWYRPTIRRSNCGCSPRSPTFRC
jgi:DNA polymerase-1